MLFFSKQMCATLALLSSQATLMSFGEKKKKKRKIFRCQFYPLPTAHAMMWRNSSQDSRSARIYSWVDCLSIRLLQKAEPHEPTPQENTGRVNEEQMRRWAHKGHIAWRRRDLHTETLWKCLCVGFGLQIVGLRWLLFWETNLSVNSRWPMND